MSTAVLDRPRVDYWEPGEAAVPRLGEVHFDDFGGHANDVEAPQLKPSAKKEFVRSLNRRARFNLLADNLASDAAGVSSTRRLTNHPAFGGILLMGRDAIPLLVERVQSGEQRPVWLKLLGSLTSLPPSAGEETIDGSADAWVRWARTEAPRG